MSDETSNENSSPELQVDDDWKSRVKEEDAALEAEELAKKEEQEETVANPIDPSQIPEADFTMLVTMFSTQAMVSLGVIPHPETGKPEPQMPLAKHFIDLLSVLEDKTANNLNDDEKKLLDDSLHNLRMGYLEISKATP